MSICFMSLNNYGDGSIWDLIRSCDRVDGIVKFEAKKRIRKVKTTENPVLVWVHYNRDNEFFGWSINKRDKLKMSGLPLLHAFVGSESRYYIVPDDDIESGKFELSTQDRGYKPKRLEIKKHKHILDKEYSKLDPFFGSPENSEE